MIERRGPLQFFGLEYALAPELVEGQEKVTVSFHATDGYETADVCGIRMIRANAER